MKRKGIFPLTDFEWDAVILTMIACSGIILYGLIGKYMTADPTILYPAPIIVMCIIILKASEDVRKKIARGERIASTEYKHPDENAR